jgi:uncharacterized membrane protein
MERPRIPLFALTLLIAAPLVTTAVVIPYLPNLIVMHWSWDGTPSTPVNSHLLWIIAILGSGIVGALALWGQSSSGKVVADAGGWAYGALLAMTALIFTGLVLQIAAWNIFGAFSPKWIIVPSLAGMLAVIGLLTTKVPPNRIIGFRTRRTLCNVDVWKDTNQKFGRALQFAALVSLTALFARRNALILSITPPLVVALWFLVRDKLQCRTPHA